MYWSSGNLELCQVKAKQRHDTCCIEQFVGFDAKSWYRRQIFLSRRHLFVSFRKYSQPSVYCRIDVEMKHLRRSPATLHHSMPQWMALMHNKVVSPSPRASIEDNLPCAQGRWAITCRSIANIARRGIRSMVQCSTCIAKFVLLLARYCYALAVNPTRSCISTYPAVKESFAIYFVSACKHMLLRS